MVALCAYAMLVAEWMKFTDREYPEPACCFGAALFALVEAAELGAKPKVLIEEAVIASRGLYDVPSISTTKLVARFLDEAGPINEDNRALACVIEIMKSVSNHKSADGHIRVLEGVLRAVRGRDQGRGGAPR
jgi:hypothetical protein